MFGVNAVAIILPRQVIRFAKQIGYVTNPCAETLAVSQQTMSTLRRGDSVQIYVSGLDTPEIGTVYEKGTVADPETRTFRGITVS